MSAPALLANGAEALAEPSTASADRDPFELFTVGEMTTRVAEIAVEKAAHPVSFLVRSLVGGAMVSFGVLLSLVVSTGVSSPGIASLLMGLAFGMSFALILVSGMSLITADMAAGAIALLQRRMTLVSYLRLLVIGLLGNCVGALTFVAVCAAAGGPYLGAFAQRAAVVAAAKTSQPTLTAILLAVICTWFLQTSMCLFFKARTDIARMGFAFYGPFAFVIGGTQHVIANIGFLGLPLLLSAFHHDAPHTALTWGLGAHGLLTNIAITTFGNLIGGTLFVAVPFQLVTRLQAAGR
jgi:formate/nitrite transporter FocA (FNT family)